MTNKTQIAVNSIFYILMILFMVGIIVFGMQKLFFTKDIVSEQERLNLQKKIKDTLEYCEDPLNKGNMKNFEIKTNLYNSICILGEDFETSTYTNLEYLLELYDGGDNIILIKTSFYKDSDGNDQLSDFTIIDSFYAEIDIPQSNCTFDKKNTGIIQMNIECK